MEHKPLFLYLPSKVNKQQNINIEKLKLVLYTINKVRHLGTVFFVSHKHRRDKSSGRSEMDKRTISSYQWKR